MRVIPGTKLVPGTKQVEQVTKRILLNKSGYFLLYLLFDADNTYLL